MAQGDASHTVSGDDCPFLRDQSRDYRHWLRISRAKVSGVLLATCWHLTLSISGRALANFFIVGRALRSFGNLPEARPERKVGEAGVIFRLRLDPIGLFSTLLVFAVTHPVPGAALLRPCGANIAFADNSEAA